MVLYHNLFYQTSILLKKSLRLPGIVVRELGLIISKYVIESCTKSKWVTEIKASDSSLSSGM